MILPFEVVERAICVWILMEFSFLKRRLTEVKVYVKQNFNLYARIPWVASVERLKAFKEVRPFAQRVVCVVYTRI